MCISIGKFQRHSKCTQMDIIMCLVNAVTKRANFLDYTESSTEEVLKVKNCTFT